MCTTLRLTPIGSHIIIYFLPKRVPRSRIPIGMRTVRSQCRFGSLPSIFTMNLVIVCIMDICCLFWNNGLSISKWFFWKQTLLGFVLDSSFDGSASQVLCFGSGGPLLLPTTVDFVDERTFLANDNNVTFVGHSTLNIGILNRFEGDLHTAEPIANAEFSVNKVQTKIIDLSRSCTWYLVCTAVVVVFSTCQYQCILRAATMRRKPFCRRSRWSDSCYRITAFNNTEMNKNTDIKFLEKITVCYKCDAFLSASSKSLRF